ncbi:DUF4928 family protein [Sphingomonas sp. PB1R3]|uniref:DUF4928 family protein n=1 Tax=Sphingomonas flavida TaxID=3096154 RepID=UPI002FC93295
MIQLLEEFVTKSKIKNKGALSIMLVVTDHARTMGLPLKAANLVVERGGQVLGAGAAKVQAILARHGIDRVLAKEGGRTSRGSIDNMKAYVAFLNDAHELGPLDLDTIEGFWVQKVREFFAAKPFTLRVDPSHGLRSTVRSLVAQAEERQREAGGTMIVGTVLQHLVGAKLQVALEGRADVEHHGANVNDVKSRGGDFDLGDTSIHVSVSPGEALLLKCRDNLGQGRRPVIVTTREGLAVAEGLARNLGIADRVDTIEVEQFLATNIYEIGVFEAAKRITAISDIVDKYNAIIDEYETDPSLKIDLATRATG